MHACRFSYETPATQWLNARLLRVEHTNMCAHVRTIHSGYGYGYGNVEWVCAGGCASLWSDTWIAKASKRASIRRTKPDQSKTKDRPGDPVGTADKKCAHSLDIPHCDPAAPAPAQPTRSDQIRTRSGAEQRVGGWSHFVSYTTLSLNTANYTPRTYIYILYVCIYWYILTIRTWHYTRLVSSVLITILYFILNLTLSKVIPCLPLK